jgi:plasmid stability protein
MRQLKERAEMHGRSPAEELLEIIEAELSQNSESESQARTAQKNAGIPRGKRRRSGGDKDRD